MDDAKCEALKVQLAGLPEPQIVAIAQFFDGNDDLGSIGCNLYPHPGIDAFRNTLSGLLGRPDVQAVYAQISELDPGDGCWPFSDVVLVVGEIPAHELRRIVSTLLPDEVGDAAACRVSPSIDVRHSLPVQAVWWD